MRRNKKSLLFLLIHSIKVSLLFTQTSADKPQKYSMLFFLFITFCVIRIWCEIDAEVLGLHSLIFFGRTEIAKPETFVTRIVKMYYFHLMMRSLEIEFMQTIKIILKI